MVHLAELPFDILLHILFLLKPRDILVSRQTCSVMRDASTNHSMWKNVLRRVCIENSIFLPSDILNYMPRLELEQAATGPSRFISHVRNPSPEGIIEAYSKRQLSTSLVENPHNTADEEILHLHLIPGGRFLISHHVRQLRMWDIGTPGMNWGPTTVLSPLATLNRYCKNVYVAHSTRDGEGLIILASTRDPWNVMDTQRVLSIFEIYPAAPSPSFREIASHVTRIDSPKEHERYCLTFDKVITVFNAKISVWDFSADTKATWALPVVQGEFIHISAAADYVILCDPTGIFLWTIPPLYPSSSPLANQVQDIEPYYHCGTGKTPGPDEVYEFDTLSDWYHGMNQPLILDLTISVEASGEVELNRYTLEFPVLSKDGPSTEPPVKIHKGIHILFQEDEGYLEDCRVSDGHVVLYWSSNSGLNIQSAPFDAPGASGYEDSERLSISVVYEMPLVERYRSTLCSVSGRLCRVVGPEIIEVVDFLGPPCTYFDAT